MVIINKIYYQRKQFKGSHGENFGKISWKSTKKGKEKEKQSLKKLADRFVLEKFDGKNVSPCQWMVVFEKERSRFDIIEDEEKIEIFRLFLE